MKSATSFRYSANARRKATIRYVPPPLYPTPIPGTGTPLCVTATLSFSLSVCLSQLTDWERFAKREYDYLAAEDDEADNSWSDSDDGDEDLLR